MRFRRIEKDTVGTGTEFIQDDKKTMANSKTYIPKPRSKKVDMNKIKNTKVGDDIHYYINGLEGRGIVVKMANEYLEIFKEDGQLGTIHINDTFFVKDILINKQWDDMDDIERYDALTKIHAPSPRYITKQWHDMPEEIKVLLQKQMPGGTGSTFEQGESKPSETQDHARTGFAQNEQYSSKKPKGCNCGDPECKDPKCKKHKKENVEKKYDKAGNRIETQAEKDAKILGKKTGKGRFKNPDQIYSAKEVKEMNRKRKLEEEAKKYPLGPQAKQLELERKQEGEEGEKKELQAAARQIDSKAGKVTTPGHAESKEDVKTSSSDSCPSCGKNHPGLVHEKKPDKKTDNDKKDKPSGGFVVDEDDYKGKALYKQWLQKKKPRPSPRTQQGFGTTQSAEGQEAQSNFSDATASAAGAIGGLFSGKSANDEAKPEAKPEPTPDEDIKAKHLDHIYRSEGEDAYEARSTKKAYEVWLERQEKSQDVNKIQEMYDEKQEDSGKDKERDPNKPGKMRRRKRKSDVEHGKLGNVGSTPEVAVSTDTKVDVTTGTGYEERPHISVEEAGKLPRSTFNESGSELTVSGSQDSKDEPKFSQPADQEQPVRKAGLPEQHPNTYGVRYGMKGGVKKVWCPEHQMWEETRKDWHE